MEALALCCWPCVPKRTPETGLRGSVLAERCRKPGAPKLTRRIFFCTGMRCVCREAQVTRNEFLEWEEATTEKTTPKTNAQNTTKKPTNHQHKIRLLSAQCELQKLKMRTGGRNDAQDWVEAWEGWDEMAAESTDVALLCAERFLHIAGHQKVRRRPSRRQPAMHALDRQQNQLLPRVW